MKKFFTKEEVTRAAKHAILVSAFASVFVFCITAFGAAMTSPTTPPPGGNLPAILSAGPAAQGKTGALGAGISNMAQFNADTSSSVGVTLENQGKTSLGPTGIFGDLYVSGSTVTLGGLKNTSASPKPLCLDSASHVVVCP